MLVIVFLNHSREIVFLPLKSHQYDFHVPLSPEHGDPQVVVSGCQREGRAQAVPDGVPSYSIHSASSIRREQANTGGRTDRTGGLAA